MYLLFRFHHIRPTEFYTMGHGEKQVLACFMARQIEDINKENTFEN